MHYGGRFCIKTGDLFPDLGSSSEIAQNDVCRERKIQFRYVKFEAKLDNILYMMRYDKVD